MMSFSVDVRLLVRIQRYVYITPNISVRCLPSLSFKAQFWENVHDVINSSEGSDILVFNCYLCHVRFLLTCYVCSTKIGEISDISKCFENFVSQTLGVLTRVYAAELRYRVYANKEFFYKDIFYTPRVSTATQNKRSGDNWWCKGATLPFSHRIDKVALGFPVGWENEPLWQ